MLLKDVPLRTRRALSLYKVYDISSLLVLSQRVTVINIQSNIIMSASTGFWNRHPRCSTEVHQACGRHADDGGKRRPLRVRGVGHVRTADHVVQGRPGARGRSQVQDHPGRPQVHPGHPGLRHRRHRRLHLQGRQLVRVCDIVCKPGRAM